MSERMEQDPRQGSKKDAGAGKDIDRRAFFKGMAGFAGGVALSGAGVTAAAETGADDKPRIRRHNILGRTKLKVGDIGLGTGGAPKARVVRYAIDRGITYIDAAPDYGDIEEQLGIVFKDMKVPRDKVVVATKMCHHIPYPGHLPMFTKAEVIVGKVNDSLRRMNTDYTDILFVHALGEAKDEQEPGAVQERIDDPELWKALDQLKKEGKYRFLAISSHSPGGFDGGGLEYAMNTGKFDLIMPSFGFMAKKEWLEIIEHARKKNIAVVAMKTAAGGKDVDLSRFKQAGVTLNQAALRWALSIPGVHCAIRKAMTFKDVDEYLGASGGSLSRVDLEILEAYALEVSRSYCRPGCGDCLHSCPRGVAVNDILRYRMYYEDYTEERHAMERYAHLEREGKVNAGGCDACPTKDCVRACPFGLAVPDLLAEAHRMLTWS